MINGATTLGVLALVAAASSRANPGTDQEATDIAQARATLPPELDSAARAHGCEPVVRTFYGRPTHLDTAYVYGVLGGDVLRSAAFWCQRGGRDPRRSFWLVIFHPISELSCPNEMRKRGYPHSLSLSQDSAIPLDDFWDPGDRAWRPPLGARTTGRAIRDYYDGVEFLYYCYNGRWLWRRRE